MGATPEPLFRHEGLSSVITWEQHFQYELCDYSEIGEKNAPSKSVE